MPHPHCYIFIGTSGMPSKQLVNSTMHGDGKTKLQLLLLSLHDIDQCVHICKILCTVMTWMIRNHLLCTCDGTFNKSQGNPTQMSLKIASI